MKVIECTHVGEGMLQARGRLDRALLQDNYPVGSLVKCRCTKPRSNTQLRYFFAFLRVVFDNLPETCPEHFEDVEHLRAWFLKQTGHVKILQLPIEDINERTIRLIKLMSHKHLFFEASGKWMYVYEPLSIALAEMEAETFSGFFKKCRDIVPTLVPGIDMQLLEPRIKEEMD